MPEETNKSPISGTVPPRTNPLGARAGGTIKLKPVIRKPGAGASPASPMLPPRPAAMPAAPQAAAKSATAPVEALKSVTQNLKSVTAPIPQQAILHKTGILADPGLTEAQKQASKARTARISLSDAMGAAPVQNEAAPMKTIRVKRPQNLNAAPAVPAAPAAAPEAPAAEEKGADVTQKKTLKIARPQGRPAAPKLGVKKPGAEPVAEEVADIPDIPDMPAAVPAAPVAAQPAGDTVAGVSKGASILGLIVQIAACAVIGFLIWQFYQDIQLPMHCGGCTGI